MKTSKFILPLWLFAAVVSAQAQDNLKAFPPAEAGMTRFVLELPKQEDESLSKVELIVGREVQVDPVNTFFFAGQIEPENIEGWGFTRYVVKRLGPMAGTLIGVDPDQPKVDRFIRLGGEPFLIRYNSRLPVVVYVPEGAEVRFRIWSTTAESSAMDQG